MSEGVSDCCLMPNLQFLKYIMGRTKTAYLIGSLKC